MKFSYIKDKFVLEQDAVISIKDRGFRFADSVFETIKIKNFLLLDFSLHLKRLKQGLKDYKIIFLEINNLEKLSLELIKRNKQKEGFLRITITRGEGSVGYKAKKNIIANLIIETENLRKISDSPFFLFLSSYQKISKKSLPTHNKLSQSMNSILSVMEAKENDCDDALLINQENNICETSCANFFAIKDNKIYTPPLTDSLVAGIVRQKLLKKYFIIEKSISLNELKKYQLIFISNISLDIKEIKEIKSNSGLIWQKNQQKNLAFMLEKNAK